jgi:gliding motility-associated-like protein
LWSPAGELQNPNAASTLVYPKNMRPNTYRLQVTDNYGCNFKSVDEVTVVMNQPVHAFAGNDTIAGMGMPLQLSGSGGVSYLWSPAHFLNNSTLQNPVTVLQNDTRFYLTVTDKYGCTGTSSVFVKVFKGPTFYVPNAFTPNGDGLNDVFKAIAPGIKQVYYFQVFNRWGQLMFNTQNITNGWDGTFKGVLQPAAVYVWVIKGVDLAGKFVELKGSVTLIR